MVNTEHVLLFARKRYNWLRRGAKIDFNLILDRLNQLGHLAYLNDYELAFRNLHYPIVLVGDVKFLKAWSLPNPTIVVPQLRFSDDASFLCTDERVRRIFLPAGQIDFVQDLRVRVGNVHNPRFYEKILGALHMAHAESLEPEALLN